MLVGIGVWYGATALTTFLLVRSNPWDTPRIYTWLSGTTYGRTWTQVVPVAVALALALPLAFAVRRELDLLALDDDTPRLVGVRLERVRLAVLLLAARAGRDQRRRGRRGRLRRPGRPARGPGAGRRPARPGDRRWRCCSARCCSALADTVGRTVIAPAQIPAGLVVALIGAPYFVYLLARSRA